LSIHEGESMILIRPRDQSLKDPKQYKPGPFNFSFSYAPSAAHVVRDGNYISGRWPGDAQAWSEAIWERASAVHSEGIAGSSS
jgi:hypothetical protein